MSLLKSVPLIRVKLMVRAGLRLNYLPLPTLWMELTKPFYRLMCASHQFWLSCSWLLMNRQTS